MAKTTKDRRDPTAFTGAELALVQPAVALAKHMSDAWKEGRPVVSPSDPLTFVVSDSETNSSGHKLTLTCSNLGAHGVYVENVIVSDPAAIDATTRLHKDPSAFGDRSGPLVYLPTLVPSGATVTLKVEISPLPADRLKKKPFGELSVSYTVLGVAKSGLKTQVEFCVRPSAV